MTTGKQETLFSLDCGATNWRLFRVGYRVQDNKVHMLGEPQPSPLTSFVDRRLPAIILLNPQGSALESLGEVACQQLENEEMRERVREYFKPCIGSHLEKDPLPHQKRYTHAQALQYTKMLLKAVLDQILKEKWRADSFDDRVRFAFAHPVHWQYDHEGMILKEFKQLVLDCFPEQIHDQVRFVAEPEGAIISLQRQGLLNSTKSSRVSLIIDIGGSTTDIVAGQVDARTGELEYIGRYGEPFGGGLFDAELAKYIADDLNIPASVIADDPSAIISLRILGQRLKESLSRQLLQPGISSHIPQRTITLVMRNGKIYRRVVKLEEATFNKITHHLNNDFINLIDNCLKEMGLNNEDIEQVVLVGGGAQLFTIIRHLRQRFGDHTVILADNPEEIVVQGIGLEYGKSILKSRPSISFSSESSILNIVGKKKKPIKETGWQLVSKDDRVFPITVGVTKIGRGRTNDIRLGGQFISRFHAELQMVDEKLEIIDLGSTNGTYVNGEQLTPNRPYQLHPDDEVIFGKMKFTCIK